MKEKRKKRGNKKDWRRKTKRQLFEEES